MSQIDLIKRQAVRANVELKRNFIGSWITFKYQSPRIIEKKTRAVIRDPIVTEKSILIKLGFDKSSEVTSPKEQIPINEIKFM